MPSWNGPHLGRIAQPLARRVLPESLKQLSHGSLHHWLRRHRPRTPPARPIDLQPESRSAPSCAARALRRFGVHRVLPARRRRTAPDGPGTGRLELLLRLPLERSTRERPVPQAGGNRMRIGYYGRSSRGFGSFFGFAVAAGCVGGSLQLCA